MIYLASTSPRRKEILKKAGISFRILKPAYEEDNGLKGLPSQIVKIHARKKAESCVRQIKDGIILGADTIVYLRGAIIGKPKNMKEACLILGRLQGRRHAVYTGGALLQVKAGRIVRKTIFFEKSRVKIKKLSAADIRHYFKKVNPLDKAGAYAVQSPHGGIIEAVQGSFSNVIGLPIEAVSRHLNRFKKLMRS